MKVRLMVMLLALVLAAAVPSFSQDTGDPDTLILLAPVIPTDGANDSLLVVELYCFNDGPVWGLQGGFGWVSDKLTLDSAKASAAALAVWSQFFFYDGSISISNANKRFMFSGFTIGANTLAGSTERKLLATYYFTVSGWLPTDQILLDSNEFDQGTEILFLADPDDNGYQPAWFWGTRGMIIQDPSDVSQTNDGLIPETYGLAQNYPNPFNPTTEIAFDVPKAGNVKLLIYNVLGQQVKSLINQEMAAGKYTATWDGKSDGNSEVASGVYFYRMEAGSYSDTKKMVMLK